MFNAPSALLLARAVSGEGAQANASAATPTPRAARRSVRRRVLRGWGASNPPSGELHSARATETIAPRSEARSVRGEPSVIPDHSHAQLEAR